MVTAAGASRRMGVSNKLMLPLQGRPVLLHCLQFFQASSASGLVVSAPPEQVQEYSRLFAQHGLSKVLQVVAGGAERQDSIRLALQALPAQSDDVVAIHDGARPYLRADLLERLTHALEQAEGSLPMVAVKDTVKRVDPSGNVLETLDRSQLFAAQTPQVFRYEAILQAHLRAHQEGFLGTDDCSLIERYGGRIRKVEGDYKNVKITTPEDLHWLESFWNG